MEKHNQRNTHESFYIKTPIGHPNKGREGEKKRGEQRDQREKEKVHSETRKLHCDWASISMKAIHQ